MCEVLENYFHFHTILHKVGKKFQNLKLFSELHYCYFSSRSQCNIISSTIPPPLTQRERAYSVILEHGNKTTLFLKQRV